MNYNNKLKNLLENVFNNIINNMDHKLSNIVKNRSNIEISVTKRVYTKSRLELEFCNGRQLNSSVNKLLLSPKSDTDNKKKLLKSSTSADIKVQISKKDKLKMTQNYIKQNDEQDVLQKVHVNITDNYPDKCTCMYLNKLVEKYNKLNILAQKKTGDYLSKILFSSLSQIFYSMTEHEQNEELKTIKLNIITEFNRDNYYRNYDYSTKHFKKIIADDTFSNNKIITVNMLKIYGDILNINIVYITNNICSFITKFNINRLTIIISDYNNFVYTVNFDDTFLRGNMCSNILEINKKYSKSTLEQMKLDVLQNIAKMYNLDIKKQGKCGRVNVKREELIDVIAIN
jgi:hypothetical protein